MGLRINFLNSTLFKSFYLHRNVSISSNYTFPEIHVSSRVSSILLNANVTRFNVNAEAPLVIGGIGNIAEIFIPNSMRVTFDLEGLISKLLVEDETAKIEVGAKVKINTVVVPEGSNASDVISNFDFVRNNIDKVENPKGEAVVITPAPPAGGGGSSTGGSQTVPTPLKLATAAKDKFKTAYDKGSLDWDTLITAIYYLQQARTAGEEVEALEGYYASIENLDMSDKDTSKYAISTGALEDFKGLNNLNLSGVTKITELGGLVGATQLTTLNISGTNVTELGALAGATQLTTLNISGTKVTNLNVLWNETAARFPNLTSLQAANIDTLTSIGGLVRVTNAEGFNPEGLVWNLRGSILAKDPDNHIGHVTSKFTSGTFTAPTVEESTPLELTSATTLSMDEHFVIQNGLLKSI